MKVMMTSLVILVSCIVFSGAREDRRQRKQRNMQYHDQPRDTDLIYNREAEKEHFNQVEKDHFNDDHDNGDEGDYGAEMQDNRNNRTERRRRRKQKNSSGAKRTRPDEHRNPMEHIQKGVAELHEKLSRDDEEDHHEWASLLDHMKPRDQNDPEKANIHKETTDRLMEVTRKNQEKFFDQADLNGDGILTEGEFNDAKQNHLDQKEEKLQQEEDIHSELNDKETTDERKIDLFRQLDRLQGFEDKHAIKQWFYHQPKGVQRKLKSFTENCDDQQCQEELQEYVDEHQHDDEEVHHSKHWDIREVIEVIEKLRMKPSGKDGKDGESEEDKEEEQEEEPHADSMLWNKHGQDGWDAYCKAHCKIQCGNPKVGEKCVLFRNEATTGHPRKDHLHKMLGDMKDTFSGGRRNSLQRGLGKGKRMFQKGMGKVFGNNGRHDSNHSDL